MYNQLIERLGHGVKENIKINAMSEISNLAKAKELKSIDIEQAKNNPLLNALISHKKLYTMSIEELVDNISDGILIMLSLESFNETIIRAGINDCKRDYEKENNHFTKSLYNYSKYLNKLESNLNATVKYGLRVLLEALEFLLIYASEKLKQSKQNHFKN